MAQIRVVEGASGWGNEKKTILRKRGRKGIETRQEKLEPSRNKVRQNRDLQEGV